MNFHGSRSGIFYKQGMGKYESRNRRTISIIFSWTLWHYDNFFAETGSNLMYRLLYSFCLSILPYTCSAYGFPEVISVLIENRLRSRSQFGSAILIKNDEPKTHKKRLTNPRGTRHALRFFWPNVFPRSKFGACPRFGNVSSLLRYTVIILWSRNYSTSDLQQYDSEYSHSVWKYPLETVFSMQFCRKKKKINLYSEMSMKIKKRLRISGTLRF